LHRRLGGQEAEAVGSTVAVEPLGDEICRGGSSPDEPELGPIDDDFGWYRPTVERGGTYTGVCAGQPEREQVTRAGGRERD
jgi:hypothetical protein